MPILVWLDYDEDDFWLISVGVPNLPSNPKKEMTYSQKGQPTLGLTDQAIPIPDYPSP